MTSDHTEAAAPSARVLATLDKTLSVQAPLVERYIAKLKRSSPDADPARILKRLTREFRAATVSTGAGVGATAAAPGVGTGVALALSGGEAVAFLNATAFYVLSRAELHGVPLHDLEHRRTLVMAVLLGNAGAKSVEQLAERTGTHWAKHIVSSVPATKLTAINRVLGQHFVTKYGTKQGIIVLGRVVPFGIGAVIGGAANAVTSQGVIKAADRAFGPPPATWPREV